MDMDDDFRSKLKLARNKKFHIEGDIWLVPCLASYISNTYQPLLSHYPIQSSNSNPDQYGWTETEDKILKKIITCRGAKAWSRISNELNTLVHNGANIRKATNCRERWLNHLNPELKKGAWSPEEDRFIEEQYKMLGKKWSKIAKKMKGRTENSVKNRCLWLIKKQKFRKIDNSELENEAGSNPRKRQLRKDSHTDDKNEKLKVPTNTIVIRPIAGRISNKNRVRSVKRNLRKAEDPLENTPSPSIFLMNS